MTMMNPALPGLGMPANISRGIASGVALATSGNPEEPWFKEFIYSALRGRIDQNMVQTKFDLLIGDLVVYQCFRYIGKSPLGACFHHSELIDDPTQLPTLLFVFRLDITSDVDSTGVRQARFKDFTMKVQGDNPIACEFSVEKTIDELPRKLYRVVNDSLIFGGDSPQLQYNSIINGLANPDRYPNYPDFKLLYHQTQSFIKEFRLFTDLTQKALIRDECQSSLRHIIKHSCNIYNIANPFSPAKQIKYHDQIRFRLTNIHKLLLGGVNRKLSKEDLNQGFIRTIVRTFFKVTDNTILPFPDCLSTYKNCPFTKPDGILLISEETYEYLMTLNIIKTVVNGVMNKPITVIRFSDEDFHPFTTIAPRQFARKREVNMYEPTSWERNEDGAFRKYSDDTQMTVAYIQSGDKYLLVAPTTEEQYERKFLDHEALTGISTFDSMVPCGVNPNLKQYHYVSPKTHYNDQHDHIHTLKMSDFHQWFKYISTKPLYMDASVFTNISYPFHRPTLLNDCVHNDHKDEEIYKETEENRCIIFKYVIESYNYSRELLIANIKNIFNQHWNLGDFSLVNKKEELLTLLTSKWYTQAEINEVDTIVKKYKAQNILTGLEYEMPKQLKAQNDFNYECFKEIKDKFKSILCNSINPYHLKDNAYRTPKEIDMLNDDSTQRNAFLNKVLSGLTAAQSAIYNPLIIKTPTASGEPNVFYLTVALFDDEQIDQWFFNGENPNRKLSDVENLDVPKLLKALYVRISNYWHIVKDFPYDSAVQYVRNTLYIGDLKHPQDDISSYAIYEIVHELALAVINEMDMRDCYDSLMSTVEQCVIKCLLLEYEHFVKDPTIWDVCSPGFGVYFTRTNFVTTDHAVLCRPSGYGNVCSRPTMTRNNKYDAAFDDVKYRSQFQHCFYDNSLNVPSILVPNFFTREFITTEGPEVVKPSNILHFNLRMERVLDNLSLSNQIEDCRDNLWYPTICPVDIPAKMFENPNSTTGRYSGHHITDSEFEQFYHFTIGEDQSQCDIIYKDVYTLNNIYMNTRCNINTFMYGQHLEHNGNPLKKYHYFNPVASSANQIMQVHHRRSQQVSNPAMMINEETNSLLRNDVMLYNRLISDSAGVAFNQTCWSGEMAPTHEENNKTRAKRVQIRPENVKGGLYFPGFGSPVTRFSYTDTHTHFTQSLNG